MSGDSRSSALRWAWVNENCAGSSSSSPYTPSPLGALEPDVLRFHSGSASQQQSGDRERRRGLSLAVISSRRRTASGSSGRPSRARVEGVSLLPSSGGRFGPEVPGERGPGSPGGVSGSLTLASCCFSPWSLRFFWSLLSSSKSCSSAIRVHSLPSQILSKSVF